MRFTWSLDQQFKSFYKFEFLKNRILFAFSQQSKLIDSVVGALTFNSLLDMQLLSSYVLNSAIIRQLIVNDNLSSSLYVIPPPVCRYHNLEQCTLFVNTIDLGFRYTAKTAEPSLSQLTICIMV